MTINLSVPATHELKPKIMVFGIGGAGGNAVNNMITSHLEGVEFVVANTDAQALSQSLTERRIQLGGSITQGLGAGARPDIGRQAAEESLKDIEDQLGSSNMAFITCGMGGGTGTGAAPIVAAAARQAGVLTVGVVTKPFHFEGKHRMETAEAGIEELQHVVDTLIVIPNQNLFRIANEKTTFADAFKMADDVLYSGVRGVTDLMVMPGLINLDFADVRSVMMEMGKAMMGTGEAEGDKRALDAAEAAINNPLLDDVSLKGARGVLVNITGGADMTLYEVDESSNHIRDQVDREANIIFGSTFDEGLSGRVRVSVVATGIDDEDGGGTRPAAGVERAPQTDQPMSVSPAVSMPVQRAPAAAAPPIVGRQDEAPSFAAAPATDSREPEPAYADAAVEAAPAATRMEPVLAAPAPADAGTHEAHAMPEARPAIPAYAPAPAPRAADATARPRLFEWTRKAVRGAPAERDAAPPPAAETPPRPAPRPAQAEPVSDDLLGIPPFLRRQSS